MEDLISVIIPVLNEEKTIYQTLQNVRSLQGKKEIIVVDGGSEDRTRELARERSDRIIETGAGRGNQLNKGVEVARGNVYFFLHSDSRLAGGSLQAIYRALSDPGIAGGCFSLKIDNDHWLLKYMSWSSNLRARYLKLMFGDQGIFVRKSVFTEVGGFPDQVLMEDWEFSRRLARSDHKLVVLPHKIHTSDRRFRRDGIWKTFLLMQKIKFLYLLGIKPTKLKEIYRETR